MISYIKGPGSTPVWKNIHQHFLMFGFYVGKRVLQEVVARYGSCTLAKMLSFCLVEKKFKRGGEDGWYGKWGWQGREAWIMSLFKKSF